MREKEKERIDEMLDTFIETERTGNNDDKSTTLQSQLQYTSIDYTVRN